MNFRAISRFPILAVAALATVSAPAAAHKLRDAGDHYNVAIGFAIVIGATITLAVIVVITIAIAIRIVRRIFMTVICTDIWYWLRRQCPLPSNRHILIRKVKRNPFW